MADFRAAVLRRAGIYGQLVPLTHADGYVVPLIREKRRTERLYVQVPFDAHGANPRNADLALVGHTSSSGLVHEAILAGHSARFLTAADLILDLTRQETARALQHRLRSYLRPTLLAIDEVGYRVELLPAPSSSPA